MSAAPEPAPPSHAAPPTSAGDGEPPGSRAEARARLWRELSSEPWRHDFFQALRRVEALHPEVPRLGRARRPADEPVRLGQAADLAFAPAELFAVSPDDRGGRPRIEVRFFGLFGPNGPLPLHLTAYARERRIHKGDETFSRFADLFHHRLLLLFYRAWAQAQPTASADRPEDDRFAEHVGALLGVGGPEWRGRDAAPWPARLAFAGLLARQVRNADGLQHLLSGYLGRAVRVESFAGRWMPLPLRERTRLGLATASRRHATCRLGASAVLGATVFDRQHHLRLHVGPLDLEAFEALLPTGSALPAVEALVAQYLGLEFDWDLELTLRGDAVPRARLGAHSRLGWTSWIGERPRRPALRLLPGRRPARVAAPAAPHPVAAL
jgi:type VI secretion system protein ImpH